MSCEKDLIIALRESLTSDGSLSKFKAEMCHKIINTLNADSFDSPPQPKNVLLLNELIREYFDWLGFKYSKTVFLQEAGLNAEPLPRAEVLRELGVTDSDVSVKFPVLYGLLSSFTEDGSEDKLNK